MQSEGTDLSCEKEDDRPFVTTAPLHRHVYPYPWEAVVGGYEAKFDAIPDARLPDLQEVKWTGHWWDAATRTAHCVRHAMTRIKAPVALEYLIGVSTAEFKSEISINREKREMHTYTSNITFSSLNVSLEEHAHFTPSPSDPNETLLTVTAACHLPYIPLVQNTLSSWALASYVAGIAKSREYEKPFIQAAAAAAGANAASGNSNMNSSSRSSRSSSASSSSSKQHRSLWERLTDELHIHAHSADDAGGGIGSMYRSSGTRLPAVWPLTKIEQVAMGTATAQPTAPGESAGAGQEQTQAG